MSRRKERLDTVDAEAIREMKQSRGWRLVLKRLELELARKKTELVQPQAEINTATTRGFIRGIETALKIPDILEKEGNHELRERAKED